MTELDSDIRPDEQGGCDRCETESGYDVQNSSLVRVSYYSKRRRLPRRHLQVGHGATVRQEEEKKKIDNGNYTL